MILRSSYILPPSALKCNPRTKTPAHEWPILSSYSDMFRKDLRPFRSGQHVKSAQYRSHYPVLTCTAFMIPVAKVSSIPITFSPSIRWASMAVILFHGISLRPEWAASTHILLKRYHLAHPAYSGFRIPFWTLDKLIRIATLTCSLIILSSTRLCHPANFSYQLENSLSTVHTVTNSKWQLTLRSSKSCIIHPIVLLG